MLSVVTAALARLCSEHPKLNSSWDGGGDRIVLHEAVNMGIATDTEEGLVVTVIRDADSRSASELASEIERLAAAARDRKVSTEEVTGGTITISNVGSFGATYGTPIINHPEAVILAFGVVEDRPVAVDGELAIRPVGTLSLSFDHRILDGAEAGRALKDLKSTLESSEKVRELL